MTPVGVDPDDSAASRTPHGARLFLFGFIGPVPTLKAPSTRIDSAALELIEWLDRSQGQARPNRMGCVQPRVLLEGRIRLTHQPASPQHAC